MFGDGSDGALSVTSGTTNLNLDHKYQFTTVNVSSGATLSTASTTGSVLYILATTSINIDGTIDVSNKVSAGQNTWSVVIDGVTYSSPSVANGGSGGNGAYSASGGAQGSGFGGGGAGGGMSRNVGGTTTDIRGGNGGTGGASPTGGYPGNAQSSVVDLGVGSNGSDGTSGGGGGGGAWATRRSSGDPSPIQSVGGQGALALGANGYTGNYMNAGSFGLINAAGGGGAGGSAGKPGVHVILIAPSVTIGGSIVTSGTNGSSGGNGASGINVRDTTTSEQTGGGGGGGGGGNAGTVRIEYSTTYLNTGTITTAGGAGGSGGAGYVSGVAGTAGSNGSLTIVYHELTSTIKLAYVYDGTAWNRKLVRYYNGSNFLPKGVDYL